MKTLIIDDELSNIASLRGTLEKHFPKVQIVGEAHDGEEGLKMIARTKPDLLLLDIEMPGMTGFEMLEKLDSYPFVVIFVTGYNQYGIHAVKMSALDYLLKPVKLEELRAALAKAEARLYQQQWTDQIRQLLENYRNPQAVTRIQLPSANAIDVVTLSDITHCEADNSYTTFYLNNEEKIMVSKSISEYEELLAVYGFKRCHQSHLVNSIYIRKLLRNEGYWELLLTDGAKIPVSRNRRDEIRLFLLNGGPGLIG